MRIAVFGATGRTGRPLVEQALGRGHEVVIFVRDATGLRSPVREDDRVSVLGQPSGGPDDLLTEAGRHVLTAMGLHGVERFVTLVGAGVRDEDESVSLGGRVMDTLLKLVARSVLEDAQDHVEMVRAVHEMPEIADT
ncbi:MAG: NAD(P)H-binding protein [Halovenus sp.]